jgi:hypothetical protein
VPQRVLDLVLVPGRGGEQVLDTDANGLVGRGGQDGAAGLEDVDEVARRQAIEVALRTALPRLRRTAESVSAPFAFLRLLHRPALLLR